MFGRFRIRTVVVALTGFVVLGAVSNILIESCAELADRMAPGRSPHSGSLGFAIRLLIKAPLTVIGGIVGGVVMVRWDRGRR